MLALIAAAVAARNLAAISQKQEAEPPLPEWMQILFIAATLGFLIWIGWAVYVTIEMTR